MQQAPYGNVHLAFRMLKVTAFVKAVAAAPDARNGS